jgi:hypothetical protein
MIHDEIVSGIYQKIKTVLPTANVFKYYSNVAGERIVIQVKSNDLAFTIQTVVVWVNIYVPLLNNLVDSTRTNQLKASIETAIDSNISLPSGIVWNVKVSTIAGPIVDPETPAESLQILKISLEAR